uniref:F-box domain-containing protein n=1 Tax=Caenorhabditis tropicalis TaxID=1561998 RepID=A0A1I7UNZ2_9PELO
MASFNLLDLPYVARQHVFKQMGFLELFDMSLCSKQMKNFVKSSSKKWNCKMSICVDEHFSISIYDLDDEVLAKFESLSRVMYNVNEMLIPEEDESIINYRDIDMFHLPSIVYTGDLPVLRTFWMDSLMGGKVLLKHLIDIFSFEMDHLTVWIDELYEDFQSIIRWINRIPCDLKTFNGKEIDFLKYIWMLENVDSTSEVKFGVSVNGYSKVEELEMNFHEKMTINNAQWIDPNHLFSMNCFDLKIQDSMLTEEEINGFLKTLKEGSNPNLHEMLIEFDENHKLGLLEEIMDGLDSEEHSNGLYNFELENGNVCSVKFFIQSNQNGQLNDAIRMSIDRD